MTSRLHPSFRRCFRALPHDVQEQARQAYRRFQNDPAHPSLQFKRLHVKMEIWSVRVSDSYCAVGVLKKPGEIIWFFIGTHAEYDKLIANL